MISTSPRASPLPPDERRAALIASTLSLVLAHGTDVSTRQIAQAAGVAEGTIFRVFATKDELVGAAVTSAFDATQLLAELTAVDRDAPLEDRLVAVVKILQRHTARIFRLLDALGMKKPVETGRHRKARADQTAMIRQAIAGLLRPDHDLLRCEPYETARRLHLLTVAGCHPRLVEEDPLPPEEIVSTLLDGIRLRPGNDAPHPGASEGEPPC
ncbi:TetR/AcrR family transcriptional regulator [Streptosporangium sp. NBC_01639]|uniref:TetR/AcrR family transcriptional regulator n=1 Tax=Streptosporangium sp. NBC_01639 TaxID=2975948 RepID=UPI003862EAE0|nr:TetR/AcrR family transcriptional regulator [Streptosporangium sp. NBC_01639]